MKNNLPQISFPTKRVIAMPLPPGFIASPVIPVSGGPRPVSAATTFVVDFEPREFGAGGRGLGD